MREDNAQQTEKLPPYLFDQLAQLNGYTWDPTIDPIYSTYDNWHVFGHRHISHDAASSSIHSGTSSASSPRLRPHRVPTGLYEKQANSYQGVNGQSTSTIIPEDTLVIARVSTHGLRIEREYYLCKSFIETSDSECRHVCRIIDLVRLPGRANGAVPLTVIICVSPGRNYLRSYLDFGPAFLGPPHCPANEPASSIDSPPGQPQYTSTAGQTPVSLFLDFAIGASECLEG